MAGYSTVLKESIATWDTYISNLASEAELNAYHHEEHLKRSTSLAGT